MRTRPYLGKSARMRLFYPLMRARCSNNGLCVYTICACERWRSDEHACANLLSLCVRVGVFRFRLIWRERWTKFDKFIHSFACLHQHLPFKNRSRRHLDALWKMLRDRWTVKRRAKTFRLKTTTATFLSVCACSHTCETVTI